MSLLLQQPSITQASIKPEATDVIEDSSSVKKCICSLCGFRSSKEKFLTNHVKFCKNVENHEDRLGFDPTAVQKEEMESMELVDKQATSELTLDIKDEEIELTETTVTVYEQSIDSPKAETPEKIFLCGKYDDAAPQSTHHKEGEEVFKPMKTNTGVKPFKCTICDYAAAKSSNLTRHMSGHTGEKQFKCTICDYGTARTSHLIDHIRTHTSEKPFKCSICDYAGVKSCNLTRHMRTHSGVKPFKCSICGYASARSSHLTTHMSKHTGEKPFKCTLCDFTCVQSYLLIRHNRTHTKAKPFKCFLCDYASAQKSYLIEHTRLHACEKLFKCSICDYAGVRSSNLTRHMRTRHRAEKTHIG